MTELPTLVLLPGLDGTGLNFGPLVEALAGTGRSVVVDYPCTAPSELGQLEAHVRTRLPTEPYLLVAESFSGPLGLRMAASGLEDCVGLVIVASFHRFPRGFPAGLVRMLAPLVFAIPPPRWALRWALTGSDASGAVVDGVVRSLAANGPGVLASRVTLLSGVDETRALQQVTVPMLYLQSEHDRTVPAWNLDRILAVRPDVAVLRIPSAHLVLQTAPVEALEAMRSWWRSVGVPE